MTPQTAPLNSSSSIRTRFAHRFLRDLKKLNKQRSCTSWPTTRETIYRRIKAAADASMASAVGPRRAWSRAILLRTKNRALMKQMRRGRRRRGNPKKEFGLELRKIVPGGTTMDICSLLDETAHYIKCLTTQVQVMRDIVDICSSTT